MEKCKLINVYFNKLKSLKEVEISFSSTLTAIMGVNGSGKTTVIHALACAYQPDGNGENHKFPEFFVPNTDSLWNGSEFIVTNKIEGSRGQRSTLSSRKYGKFIDRWSPQYSSRPKRNVYYIGIDTCLPDIEKQTSYSRIIYRSSDKTDRQSVSVSNLSAYILNKSYDHLLENTYKTKRFPGVQLKSGLKYSSLSMGSGEQRVIKIVSVLKNAEAYSLVLIDEIDLLLHISALRRLIEKIYKIAYEKHIQVVFTTHSLEMINLSEYVKIQYIHSLGEDNPSSVFSSITPDLIFSMTGQTPKTQRIYVEDVLAKCLIIELVRKKHMLSYTDIITYGAIENAFTIAAGLAIQNVTNDNILVVLDGDRYITTDEKMDQIKKKLSGTEEDADQKRIAAANIITEFILPNNTSPEEFLHDIIIHCFPKDNEIYIAAKEIHAVDDSHEWIDSIRNRIGLDINSIVHEIFNYASENEQFKAYLNNIDEWLESHITE